MSAPLPTWADELLRSARVGRLATADPAGQPLVVPVCYVFADARVYTAIDAKPKRTTGRGLRRVRNIEANPRVSLVVDEYDEDWSRLRYVIVDGRAALLTEGDTFARALDLLAAKYPQYRTLRLDRTAGLVIAITPSRTRCWRFASPPS